MTSRRSSLLQVEAHNCRRRARPRALPRIRGLVTVATASARLWLHGGGKAGQGQLGLVVQAQQEDLWW